VVSVASLIRDARPEEAEALAELQRRASLIWDEYRAQLLAHPEVIEPETAAIAAGRVRVAVDEEDRPLGLSVALPVLGGAVELDGLFVEPDAHGRGIGRALVADAAARARAAGATRMDVTAGPATGFYERCGFVRAGETQTRFGPALRLTLAL
jgi:GNAT superfamily N-acetyltransferase